MMELEAVKRLMPTYCRREVTQELLDRIEAIGKDPEMGEVFKENFVGYLNVMKTGKYKVGDYLNAVKYVSYKLMGHSNRKAYMAVFPDRVERIKADGNLERIDAWVSAYNRTKLVNAVYEQTLVPVHVLNAPLHQEALNELAKVIRDPGTRGMTKVKACEAILAYTKPPEVIKSELTIGIQQSDAITDLREAAEALAGIHKSMLEKGYKSLRDVAEAEIISTECKEVEDGEIS